MSCSILLKKLNFHLIFWFIVINLMEMITYLLMRTFAIHGDIGNINYGLGLNPLVLFFPGTILILVWLYYLFGRVLPGMYAILPEEKRMISYVILIFSAFFVLIWCSGIKVVLYLYPDPQWMLGLAGFFAFGIILYLCRPVMPWIIKAKEKFTEDTSSQLR